MSGTQPIYYARVTVYCAQASVAEQVAQGEADGNGLFTFTVTRGVCDGIFYAVAVVPADSRITLATVIGPAINGNITINELTTVATAYALAQFFNQEGYVVGKALPLKVAAGFAEELVDPASGAVSAVIQSPPNANQTNTWPELGTLANILAACVNLSGGFCDELFNWTGTTGPGPVTTLQAMVNIAHHPAANLNDLFALSEARAIYTPHLTAALNGPGAENKLFRLDAFTVAIKVNATEAVAIGGREECPFGGPGNLVFDERGYAWIIINTIQGQPVSAHCQVVLKPNGQPADGANGTPRSPLHGGGLLGQGFGVGLDPNGHVWSGNFGWGMVFPQDAAGNTAGSVSEFTLQGVPLSPEHTGHTGTLCRVQGVASDAAGNIWMMSWGNDAVEVFLNGDPNKVVSYSRPHTQPFGVALDQDGAAWVTNEGTSTVAKFKLAGNKIELESEVAVSATVPPENPPANPPPNPCFSHPSEEPAPPSVHPKGIAVDGRHHVWAVASTVDGVSVFDADGTRKETFHRGGIVRPWGVAVDSHDNVWVANFGNIEQAREKYGITELCGYALSGCTTVGDPITPDTGYTLPSGGDPVLLRNGDPLYGKNAQIQSFKPLMRMTAVAVDMAGNVWAINNWKPEAINDTLLQNPGGDGIVIFIGLAAPVKPVPYSAPPQAP